jgi:aminoglycoside phosphotransferase (APT) family kinase protein
VTLHEVRDAGPGAVLKVYDTQWAWKLDKEVFVYGLLEGRDLPVASILRVEPRRLLLSRLDGDIVLSLLDQLTEDEFLDIARQVGSVLRRVHEVRFGEFGYIGTAGLVEPHATNAAYMRFQFDKKLRRFGELDGDRALGAAIARFVDENGGLFAGCAQAVLCHDDCHEANVLVDSRLHVSGLVDWENAVAGDPLLDLAKAHCYSRRRSPELLDALADGYGDLRPGWREAVRLYELYHWLELWEWFAAASIVDGLAELAESMRGICTG